MYKYGYYNIIYDWLYIVLTNTCQYISYKGKYLTGTFSLRN